MLPPSMVLVSPVTPLILMETQKFMRDPMKTLGDNFFPRAVLMINEFGEDEPETMDALRNYGQLRAWLQMHTVGSGDFWNEVDSLMISHGEHVDPQKVMEIVSNAGNDFIEYLERVAKEESITCHSPTAEILFKELCLKPMTIDNQYYQQVSALLIELEDIYQEFVEMIASESHHRHRAPQHDSDDTALGFQEVDSILAQLLSYELITPIDALTVLMSLLYDGSTEIIAKFTDVDTQARAVELVSYIVQSGWLPMFNHDETIQTIHETGHDLPVSVLAPMVALPEMFNKNDGYTERVLSEMKILQWEGPMSNYGQGKCS